MKETTEWAIAFLEGVTSWTESPDFFGSLCFMAMIFFGAKYSIKAYRRSRRNYVVARDVRNGRFFSNAQKNEGHRRAGHQCEFSDRRGRCQRRSEHGDHFYPAAKGGATSMRNFVASCAQHNLSKGAKLPSRREKQLIESRRTKYFPGGADTVAGEWL